MCLSSPIPGQKQTPAVGHCNGSCSLDRNGNRSSTSVPNGGELKHRTHATDATHNLIRDEENLGYKEENAVYRENAQEQQKLLQEQDQKLKDAEQAEEEEYNPQIRWPDLGAQAFLHIGALYGLYLLFYANFYTFLWGECPPSSREINI
ncbi:hypothetical protein M5D96_003028 [Drosophila gunungcola]|uniref:Uncharacterized protein n=1 Tax=Drosophila gunungcola TaxID=103775 RepID=A0A9P9Z1G8_9MUSC|nr:hypothetical protein M5D96_003028 [Drosophila gunungcola]